MQRRSCAIGPIPRVSHVLRRSCPLASDMSSSRKRLRLSKRFLPLGIRSPIVVDLRPRRLKHIPSPQTAPSAHDHSRGLGPLSSLAALASRASCSISYGLPPITSGAFEPVDDLRNVNSAKVSASGNRIPPPKESVNFPLSKA